MRYRIIPGIPEVARHQLLVCLTLVGDAMKGAVYLTSPALPGVIPVVADCVEVAGCERRIRGGVPCPPPGQPALSLRYCSARREGGRDQ